MPQPETFEIVEGFTPTQRGAAAALFWQAFGDKLRPVMRPEAKALAVLTAIADPTHAISAVTPDGTLLGIAGFKTSTGAFMGGDLKALQAVYGWAGGLWRGLLLSLLDRPLPPDTLLMDGIMVAPAARGQGVGTALLCAIKAKAAASGCARVKLDVIDSNPRARALYEREGFIAQRTTGTGPLRFLFGFRKSTEMTCAAGQPG